MRDLPQPAFPVSTLGRTEQRLSAPHELPVKTTDAKRKRTRLEVVSASSEEEVRQAQTLRYVDFVQGMGARPTVPRGTHDHDAELFDTYCEHLMVRAEGTDGSPGPVFGTCRIVTPGAARRVGGWYSQTEFVLTRLAPLTASMMEPG